MNELEYFSMLIIFLFASGIYYAFRPNKKDQQKQKQFINNKQNKKEDAKRW